MLVLWRGLGTLGIYDRFRFTATASLDGQLMHLLIGPIRVFILAPLPDVAMHIMQSPCVRLKTANGRCEHMPVPLSLFERYHSLASHVVGILRRQCRIGHIAIRVNVIGLVATAVGRAGASPTCVFPFGFRRQSIARVLLLAKPLAKCVRVLPGDTGYRMFVRLRKARLQPMRSRLNGKTINGFFRVGGKYPSFSGSLGVGLITRRRDKLTKMPHGNFAVADEEIIV